MIDGLDGLAQAVRKPDSLLGIQPPPKARNALYSLRSSRMRHLHATCAVDQTDHYGTIGGVCAELPISSSDNC